MKQRERAIQPRTGVIAQLDPHQAHAPRGRAASDGEPAIGKADHQDQKRKEKQRGKGCERHNQDRGDQHQRRIDNPRQCAFQRHARIKIGVSIWVGQGG